MKLAGISVVAGALICASAWQFSNQRISWRFIQLIGAGFLGLVVLTHIAERFSLFPGMGWGRPNTVGHYLDLASAILGLVMLPLGYIGSAVSGIKHSN